MKVFHFIHAGLTVLLVIAMIVLAAKVDAPAAQPAPVQQQERGGLPAVKPPGAMARLFVVRGLKPGEKYCLFEGPNFLGRADEKPVDIDLTFQEPEERVWSSRQHAVIICEKGALTVEDLNSANGTYVNRKRVPPGNKQPIKADDIIQIGEVQLKVQP